MLKDFAVLVDGIEVHVTRKRVKRLNLRVTPPMGQVRVSIPASCPEHEVTGFVQKHADRIRRVQKEIEARRLAAPRVLYETGEEHFYAGDAYTLAVVTSTRGRAVTMGQDKLVMQVRPGDTQEVRGVLLDAWYRAQLYQKVPGLIKTWVPRIGQSPNEVRVRKMKTRWGTCNPIQRRIWLSLELAKRPEDQLEYVWVHELIHLLQAGHPPRFWHLMDRHLPDWRVRKHALDCWKSEAASQEGGRIACPERTGIARPDVRTCGS